MLHPFKQWAIILFCFAAVRATPGLKMMKLLTASNAKRSFPSHAGRWGPSFKECLLMGIIGNGLCLCRSTTVGTAETFTAAVVPVTSWRCPPTLGPCGCAMCVTPCYYSGAPLVLPDTKSCCCCCWWFEILHCSHVKEIQHSTLMGGAYLGHTNTFIGWWEGFDWLISIFQIWNTFELLLRIISLAGLWWHAFCYYCHLL